MLAIMVIVMLLNGSIIGAAATRPIRGCSKSAVLPPNLNLCISYPAWAMFNKWDFDSSIFVVASSKFLSES